MVMRHPVQVGIQVFDLRQLFPSAPKLQKNIMDTILGHFPGLRHFKQIGVELAPVVDKQPPEGLLVAFGYLQEQVLFFVW